VAVYRRPTIYRHKTLNNTAAAFRRWSVGSGLMHSAPTWIPNGPQNVQDDLSTSGLSTEGIPGPK
jgi:hypothetical protein